MTKPIGGAPGTLLIHIPNHTYSASTLEFTVEFLVTNLDLAPVEFIVYLNSVDKEWDETAPAFSSTNFKLTHSDVYPRFTDKVWSIKGQTFTSGKTLNFTEIDFTVREISI